MRLLIVSQYFWPEEFRINDVAEDMVKRGHEVDVLTGWPNYPSGEFPADFLANRDDFRSYKGARIFRARLIPRGRGGGLAVAANYLSFVVSGCWSVLGMAVRGQKYDAVLVFQISPITAALPATLLRGLTGSPVVLWVQDLWPETLKAVGAVRSPALLNVIGGLVNVIYRWSDRILVQSRAFHSQVKQRAGSDHHIAYLPNWTDQPDAAAPVVRAEELEPYKSTFNLMFAGNLGEAQDLPSLVRAADLCRDIPHLRWLIVGEGRGQDAMMSEVARRGLEDRVIFLGRQPATRMAAFFAGADGLIVSLKAEPIFALTVPSKVQAYLAAGKPILGMLDGEGGRVIEEASAGWVGPAGDVDALAHNVRRLVAASPDERVRMGQAGAAYCQRHFTRDQLMASLEDVLANARGRPARAG